MSADELDDFRWPEPDDDLFGVSPGRWRAVADLESPWGYPSGAYAIGYREAAEILVKHVIETGFDQDTLVFPILFIYRQFVELRLKEIAVASRRLTRADMPKGLLERHELPPLWKFCREQLTEIEQGRSVDDLDNAERTLKQLWRVDPGSYSFRYPTDKSGNRSLPGDLRRVDLGRVFHVMSGVCNLLDGIVDMLADYQEWEDEMARECAPY